MRRGGIGSARTVASARLPGAGIDPRRGPKWRQDGRYLHTRRDPPDTDYAPSGGLWLPGRVCTTRRRCVTLRYCCWTAVTPCATNRCRNRWSQSPTSVTTASPTASPTPPFVGSPTAEPSAAHRRADAGRRRVGLVRVVRGHTAAAVQTPARWLPVQRRTVQADHRRRSARAGVAAKGTQPPPDMPEANFSFSITPDPRPHWSDFDVRPAACSSGSPNTTGTFVSNVTATEHGRQILYQQYHRAVVQLWTPDPRWPIGPVPCGSGTGDCPRPLMRPRHRTPRASQRHRVAHRHHERPACGHHLFLTRSRPQSDTSDPACVKIGSLHPPDPELHPVALPRPVRRSRVWRHHPHRRKCVDLASVSARAQVVRLWSTRRTHMRAAK